MPSLFSTTFYLPSRFVRQFELLQDALKGNSIALLRGLVLCPSIVTAFDAAWHERIGAPFRRVLASIISIEEYLLEKQSRIDRKR